LFIFDNFCNVLLVYLNTDDINTLLKEAYNVNTKLNNEGIHTWYTVALKIFDECEMDSGEYENLD
jgi:ATP-dependent protease HslVU (ClpYQ) ATPase subunit